MKKLTIQTQSGGVPSMATTTDQDQAEMEKMAEQVHKDFPNLPPQAVEARVRAMFAAKQKQGTK